MAGTSLGCFLRTAWLAASIFLPAIFPSIALAGSANPRGGTVKEVPPPGKGGGSYRLHVDIFFGNDVAWRDDHKGLGEGPTVRRASPKLSGVLRRISRSGIRTCDPMVILLRS